MIGAVEPYNLGGSATSAMGGQTADSVGMLSSTSTRSVGLNAWVKTDYAVRDSVYVVCI